MDKTVFFDGASIILGISFGVSVAISFSTAMASFTTSISTNGIPCLTMSPTAMFIDLTMPLTEAGISIAALSVSNIMIESSESIT